MGSHCPPRWRAPPGPAGEHTQAESLSSFRCSGVARAWERRQEGLRVVDPESFLSAFVLTCGISGTGAREPWLRGPRQAHAPEPGH